MKKFYLISAFGKDRSGIVAGVTRALLELGANIDDASMTRLGGEFSMMVIAAMPDDITPARLKKSLSPASRNLGVDITARPIPPELALSKKRDEPDALISVYGTDKPGIVYEVAQLLAKKKVNITDLNTKVIPGSGNDLYVMLLEIRLPTGISAASMRDDLTRLQTSLGVQITLQELDSVSL
jgi:glycine cleavage system transcriptional repressor